MILWGETRSTAWKTPSQCHFVQHIFHVDVPRANAGVRGEKPVTEIRDTKYDGWEWALLCICCALSGAVVFVLHVNVAFMWSSLLVIRSICATGVLKHGRKVLHRQTRELVYKVFSYFKCEADVGMAGHYVSKVRERTVEACDVSLGSV
jgi:hypothetical protein